MDSSATKLFECDLGHEIIVSWEATNRFSRLFVFHIGGMIWHIGKYLYIFQNLFCLLLDAQSKTSKHVNSFVAHCMYAQDFLEKYDTDDAIGSCEQKVS